jgi:anti-anti-sigma factor
MDDLGLKQRSIGSVTVLDVDCDLRTALKFGGSGVSLERAVESLLSSGRRHILLNLGGVKSVGAKGMGELVSTYVAITNDGGEFKLFNLTPTVRQLMSATNLSAVFAFYESEKLALESFANELRTTGEMMLHDTCAE